MPAAHDTNIGGIKLMNKIGWTVIFLIFVIFLVNPVFAQEDAKGCKDHPLFTRMPNFHIKECREKDFEQVNFIDEKGKAGKVEGKFHWAEYGIKKGLKAPSDLQLLRNYQNAIKAIGGVVSHEKLGGNFGYTYLKLSKTNKIYWVIVYSRGGDKYELTIVEKAEMEQQIVVDAKSLMSDIQMRGSASVYGIYFDFDKADIKPESEPAIREVAKLLNDNRALKLYVVGHTDNVGGIDYNIKLSKARADAVMKELVTKHKISADRLKAYGVGSLAPVTSNKTDDGRAMNRRVELVEQ